MNRLSVLLRRLSLRKAAAAREVPVPSAGFERLVRIAQVERAREASKRTTRLLHPAH